MKNALNSKITKQQEIINQQKQKENAEKDELAQLKADMKVKNMKIKEFEELQKKSLKEEEKRRKELGKMKEDNQKKEAKWKKQEEKVSVAEATHEKIIEELKIQQDKEITGLKKEIENKTQEIVIHVKKIQEMNKNLDNQNATKISEPDQAQDDESKELKSKILELETRLKTQGKEHEKETKRLKEETNTYEARLESILENSSSLEKKVNCLNEGMRTTKAINRILEIKVAGGDAEPKDGAGTQEGELDSNQVRGNREEEEEGEKKATETKTPCRFWIRFGKCKYGDRCHFDHPEKEGSSEEYPVKGHLRRKQGVHPPTDRSDREESGINSGRKNMGGSAGEPVPPLNQLIAPKHQKFAEIGLNMVGVERVRTVSMSIQK